MKRFCLAVLSVSCAAFFLAVLPVGAQQQPEEDKPPAGAIAQKIFIANCMTCHEVGNSSGRAPSRETLMKLTPEAVYAALTTGPMTEQAKNLTDDEKRGIAAFLGGRPLGSTEAGDAKFMSNRCASNPPISNPSSGPALSATSIRWMQQAGACIGRFKRRREYARRSSSDR